MLNNRLDLTDRIVIEYRLSSKKTFKQIAEELHKNPSSITELEYLTPKLVYEFISRIEVYAPYRKTENSIKG